jgi:cellulose synthase/poly-beta-1,6-N-acetylglucosamine synthase-like glycosyltransferase
MVIFLFAYYVIFVGMHITLMIGIVLEWLREKKALKNAAGELPKVSVIIPVRNESHRIEGLLKSLESQEYPHVEFIFIDDRSHDESTEMINAFIRGAGDGKSRIISLKENPGPNFKQYALTRGIEESSGEFLLFTDADCEIPPFWVRGMVMRMSDIRTGAMIGPVFKRSVEKGFFGGKGFFHLYQCFEHGIRYVYLAGATGLGAAGGGFGNNLILRRACLDAVGGYEKVPPSPTEDAALVSRIRSCSDYRIRAALGKDVHVITHGENTWTALVNQTLRWNNGGLFSPDLVTRLNYNFLMITIGMGVLAAPLLPFFPSLWPLPLGVVTSMIFNTTANLGLFAVSLPRGKLAYGLTLLFTPVYFPFMTILGYLGFKPKWKGEEV